MHSVLINWVEDNTFNQNLNASYKEMLTNKFLAMFWSTLVKFTSKSLALSDFVMCWFDMNEINCC